MLGVIFTIILSTIIWQIRKKSSIKRALKYQSLVCLLYRRALDEAEECVDGIKYKESKDGLSLICYFPLEILMAQDSKSMDEYSSLWLLHALELPQDDNGFMVDLFRNKSNWTEGVEIFADMSLTNYIITIKIYTDIDLRIIRWDSLRVI